MAGKTPKENNVPLICLRCKRKPTAKIFALAVLVVIFFTGPDSFLIEWNSEVTFLIWKPFEGLARHREDETTAITNFSIAHFNSVSEFLVAVIVIAIFGWHRAKNSKFRGMLQLKLQQLPPIAHM